MVRRGVIAVLLIFVQFISAENFVFEQALTGLPGQNEANMVRDHEGMLWFHGYGSLFRYDGYEVTYYTPGKNSISDPAANSIQVDTSGNIWILTQNSGLTQYDKSSGKFVHYQHDPNNSNSILSNQSDVFNQNRLFVTKRNELLIGTYGGFDIYDIDRDKFTHYVHDSLNSNSISSNKVNAVIEGADGTIWIGTDRGLNAFNRESGEWKLYLHNPKDSNSICSDDVWALMEDRDGEIWIGTRTNGVSRFNRKENRFTHYTMILTMKTVWEKTSLFRYIRTVKAISGLHTTCRK